MITVPRTIIRKYAKLLLASALESEVGSRIYFGRVSPLQLNELPALVVLPFTEEITREGGTEHLPDGLDRNITMTILIVVDRLNDLSRSEDVEDRLDLIGRKLEKAFVDDRRFQKLLSTWDGNIQTSPGLLAGSVLKSVDVDLETEAETTISMMALTFNLLYEDLSYNPKREHLWTEYGIELRRVGWNEDTVDPIVIAAEGEF